MSVRAAFQSYAVDESPSALRRLHEAIIAEPGFDPATPWFARAMKLLTQQRYDEVIRIVTQQMPGAFFSPDAHQMLSHSFAGIGQDERARFEATVADKALAAITSSGTGERDRPWQVLRVADEYAVLRDRGIEAVSQEVVRIGERAFDVHRTAAGREVWFELLGGIR